MCKNYSLLKKINKIETFVKVCFVFVCFFTFPKVSNAQSLVVSTNTTLTAAQFLTYTSYTIQPGVTLNVTGAVTMTSNVQIVDNGSLVMNNNLTIQNGGAALAISGTGSLSVSGNVLVSGVPFTDGVATTIGGTFTEQNGGASVTVSSTFSVTGALTVNGTPFTVASTSTVTAASLSLLNGGGSITDNGYISISGNANTNGDPISGTGSLYTGGTITATNAGASIFGSTTSCSHCTYSTSGFTTPPTTYTAQASTNWTVTTTWNPNGTPTASDNIIIPNGFTVAIASNQSITNASLTGSGSLSFTSTKTLTATGSVTMGGSSSISGTATGSLTASTFTVSNGANVTLGRLGMAISGTSEIDGTLNLTSATGSKTFTGDVTVNGGALYFTAAPTITMSGNLNMSGTCSIDGTSTGVVNVTNGFNVNASASATIGNTTIAITGSSSITGTLTISNTAGTKTLTGATTMANGGNITFSAAETLTLGTSLTCNGTNSITNAAAGIVSTPLVTINGTTTIDGAATGTTNFTSTLGVSASAVLNIGNTALTVTGATSVSGNLNFTNASGTKTFANITINVGGTWDASAVDQTYNIATGNLTNSGTFNAGATSATIYSFTGTSQINGILSIPSITVVSGTTTNNATLTVSNQLSGAGTFTQGSTGYLYYAASANIAVTTFVASTASNTVDYTYAGAQNIKKVIYYNLTVSTSGTKILLGATTVSGNLNVTGTAQLDVDATNNYALNVAGNWNLSSTNASPFLAEAGTVTFNGTSGTQSLNTTTSQESFYSLTINNTSGSATGISVDKNTTVNNVFTLTSGTISIGTNSLTCLGNAAVNAGGISGTGIVVCTGSVVTFGTTSGGPTVVPTVSISTSSISMQRGTYSSAVTVTKIPSTNVVDSWRGGNTYNGVFTLINAAVGDTSGNNGDIYMGANSGDPTDVFNGNSYFYLTGSARIRVPQSGTAIFNAPAHFYSQGFGPSVAANGHDRIQPARFSPSVVTFNDSAIFYCSSATTDMYIAYDPGTTANFNKPVVATHGGSSQANFFFGGSGTVNINDDIYFNNTGSGTINIINATDGVATLASGKRLMVGSKGFISGSLTIWNLTQLGTTSQSLTLTGTAIMNVGGVTGGVLTPCTFNGSVSFSSPNINLIGNKFNGTTNSFTMSGTTNQNCYGGNSYISGSTNTFVNSSSGYWRLANTLGDTCYGNAVFKRASTGQLSPAYNNTNYFYGNVSIAAGSDSVDFCTGTGIANLAGTTSASFTNSGNKGTSMKRIVLNKTGGAGFTLNNHLGVPSGGSLALTSGLLNTSASAYLFLMNQNVTVPSLTDASTSYINGPMRYDVANNGTTQTISFPIGKGSDCRPVTLTVRHGSATSYSYLGQLFNANPWVAMNSGSPYVATNMPSTVDTISAVHYWTIDRTVTSSGAAASSTNLSYSAGNYPLIKLYFGTNDMVYQGSNLTIVKNTSAAPAAWIDIGGNCALGNSSSPQAGNITSTSAPSAFNSFSSFTLGSAYSGWNPLPIELLSFSAVPDGEKVDIKWETSTETNNDYFTIEKSKDGKTFSKLMDVTGAGTSTSIKEYFEADYQPYAGTSYYRLKQTDKNGDFKYFNMVSVNFNAQKNIVLFPNPIDNASNLNIKVSGYQNEEVVVVLRDMQGKEFLSRVLLSEGDNQLFIVDETKSLTPGAYIVTASSNDKIYNYKLIVK